MAEEAKKKCCGWKAALWTVAILALVVLVGSGVLAGVTGNRDL